MKNKRKIGLILICLVLIASSLLIFVACDDGGPEGETTRDYFIDIDDSQFEQTFYSFIGYAMKSTDNNENEWCNIDAGFSLDKDCNMFYEDIGEGYLGYCSLFEFYYVNDDYDWDILSAVILLYYDSEENANKMVTYFQENGGYYNPWIDKLLTNIYQSERVIVCELQEGFYNGIRKESISENAKNDERVKFITENLTKELRSENRYVELGEYNTLQVKKGEIINFGIYAMPKDGNREKVYRLCTNYDDEEYFEHTIEPFVEGFNNQNNDYYTAESYAEIKNLNNSIASKYVIYYMQPNAGLHFEEYENRCILTEVFYDGNSFKIPVYYNDKKVTQLGQGSDIVLRNATTLTDIYYEGTKEQWGQIYIDSYHSKYFKNVNIHCSDGIIEKTAESENNNN